MVWPEFKISDERIFKEKSERLLSLVIIRNALGKAIKVLATKNSISNIFIIFRENCRFHLEDLKIIRFHRILKFFQRRTKNRVMSSPSPGKRRMDTDVMKLIESRHEVCSNFEIKKIVWIIWRWIWLEINWTSFKLNFMVHLKRLMRVEFGEYV